VLRYGVLPTGFFIATDLVYLYNKTAGIIYTLQSGAASAEALRARGACPADEPTRHRDDSCAAQGGCVPGAQAGAAQDGAVGQNDRRARPSPPRPPELDYSQTEYSLAQALRIIERMGRMLEQVPAVIAQADERGQSPASSLRHLRRGLPSRLHRSPALPSSSNAVRNACAAAASSTAPSPSLGACSVTTFG
jgi:hypothetical protein